MNVHGKKGKKGKECSLAMTKLCHCVVRPDKGTVKFFVCCGYYHEICQDRLLDWPRKEVL